MNLPEKLLLVLHKLHACVRQTHVHKIPSTKGRQNQIHDNLCWELKIISFQSDKLHIFDQLSLEKQT